MNLLSKIKLFLKIDKYIIFKIFFKKIKLKRRETLIKIIKFLSLVLIISSIIESLILILDYL